MLDTGFGCLPTIVGSMPETNAADACGIINRYLKEIPVWPQLPRRSQNENMYIQFSQGFPGVTVKDENVVIERGPSFDTDMHELYADYISNNYTRYAVTEEYAQGLYSCLEAGNTTLHAMKGQITGPVTWGLTVKDTDGRSILYDDLLGDAVPRFLKLKAEWQEAMLRRISERTILFVDEPYMAAYGSSSTVSLSKERVISLLNEMFSGISGLRGVHCCGNTDWSVLMATDTNILSFDAYNFAGSLAIYPNDVKGFLTRRGAIAWGIVPNTADGITGETVASLQDRLEEAMGPFTRDNGIRMGDIVTQSLITPSCGMAGLPEDAVPACFELLVQLSDKMREKYL